MKILVDMNLSPQWVPVLGNEGFEAIHWSSIGPADAKDEAIADWARANGFVIFTHDLDFGTLLALTNADGPSVIQIRSQDILPTVSVRALVSVLRQSREYLESGALIVIDDARARLRILPLNK